MQSGRTGEYGDQNAFKIVGTKREFPKPAYLPQNKSLSKPLSTTEI
jgi:hypothetical protein